MSARGPRAESLVHNLWHDWEAREPLGVVAQRKEAR